MRTVRLFRLTEGANEVHRAFIARQLLKHNALNVPRPFDESAVGAL